MNTYEMANHRLAIVSTISEEGGVSPTTTVDSRGQGWKGFYAEENRLPPSELPAFEPTVPMIGMVMSSTSVRYTWKENGREHEVLFNPGNISTVPATGMPDQRWNQSITFFTVTFEPQFLNLALGPEVNKHVDLRLCPHCNDPTVAHLLWALYHDLKADHPSGRIVGEAIGTALAAATARTLSTSPPTVLPIKKGFDANTLKRVFEYVEEHLGSDLGIRELAGIAFASPYYFCRQFKASTGRSVHQYVLERRISRAKNLLQHSNLPIAEIGFLSGLPNQSHFTTVFRKNAGATPGDYRRIVLS